MTLDVDDIPKLTAYLLGRLPLDEQAQIEEEYLANPELLDRLRAVERDLIDQYVRGELTDADTFERHYLNSPQRRERVEFARSLLHWSEQAADAPLPSRQRGRKVAWRMPSFMQAAALIALLVSGVLVGLRFSNPAASRQSSPADSATSAVPEPRDAQPLPPPVRPPDTAPSEVIATFVLLPTSTRSTNTGVTIEIDLQSPVRLRLHLESVDYASYRAQVRNGNGTEVWRDDELKPATSASDPVVVLTIPAGRLSEDDYTVRLGGLSGTRAEELSGYTFRVRALAR